MKIDKAEIKNWKLHKSIINKSQMIWIKIIKNLKERLIKWLYLKINMKNYYKN